MSNEDSAVCFPTHPNCLPPKALHGMQPPADGKTKDLGGEGERQTLYSVLRQHSAFQDPEI